MRAPAHAEWYPTNQSDRFPIPPRDDLSTGVPHVGQQRMRVHLRTTGRGRVRRHGTEEVEVTSEPGPDRPGSGSACTGQYGRRSGGMGATVVHPAAAPELPRRGQAACRLALPSVATAGLGRRAIGRHPTDGPLPRYRVVLTCGWYRRLVHHQPPLLVGPRQLRGRRARVVGHARGLTRSDAPS